MAASRPAPHPECPAHDPVRDTYLKVRLRADEAERLRAVARRTDRTLSELVRDDLAAGRASRLGGAGSMTTMTRIHIDAVKVGRRHRTDLGDIDALAASIEDVGLLQPIVITLDNHLVAGARRLAAIRHLGRIHVAAHVLPLQARDVPHLLRAEAAENVRRKPFTPTEAADLATTLKIELPNFGRDDLADAVGYSHESLRKVHKVQDLAANEAQPEEVRAAAREALVEMDRTGKIDGVFRSLFDEPEAPAGPAEASPVAIDSPGGAQSPQVKPDDAPPDLDPAGAGGGSMTSTPAGPNTGPSDPVIDHLNQDPKWRKANYGLRLAKALERAGRLLTFDPERIVDKLGDDQSAMDMLDMHKLAFDEWFARLDAARAPSLTVIEGGQS